MTTVILAYAAVSLVLGGVAAMYELWSPPMMFDRVDGRGKFPAPKENALGVGLSVAVLWPFFVVAAIVDTRSTK